MNRPSPYVRRQWLAREIRRLREEHGLTAEALARGVGFPRKHLSILENGHLGPDIDLVSGICDYLTVGERRQQAIMDAATDGWAQGWWATTANQMGARQAIYADLESGTETITEYAIALIPGLLQTPAYADARLRSDPARHHHAFDPAVAVAARARRQDQILAAGGPSYTVIIDETAIRRRAADPPIIAEQLRHILDVCETRSSVSVLVLASDAVIRSHSAPCSAYSIYRYRDPQRSYALATATLTTDIIHTDPRAIDPYLSLHSRLKAAALSREASTDLIRAAADQLAPTQGVPA
ncbi:helix-turn-helix domain-containing protein [Micromonospora schwarzwaldensis]|uniref:helix-turn-helix domain-containing protein n=1 Tax=Micromonospora sp. DSM 45708 TaxID=3111767 RepID=UPI0031D7A400